eukprot:Skav219616  [mRNA]  locus=scaffold628:129077:130093:- [translate_table: standard]
MQCNRIKQANISEDELAAAIRVSEVLEVSNGRVRRKIPFTGSSQGESKGRGKGKGKFSGDQSVRAAPVVDPSGPCGYYMAGHCHHGDRCLTQHSVPYAMAIRHEWLNPGDRDAKKDLQLVAAKTLGATVASALFPRVFSQKIQKRKTSSASPDISDLGFEWGEEAQVPKVTRWKRQSESKTADIQAGKQEAHKIRYFLVFDLEGKHEIIEFPVLLFDAVAGSEIGRFQKFVRPKDLFEGCVLTETPAVQFPEVLEEFDGWLHQMVGKGLQDMAKDSSDMIFVTCGDWDCKHVKTQCRICSVPAPKAFSRWINIKRSYSDHYGGDFRGMKSMHLGTNSI